MKGKEKERKAKRLVCTAGRQIKGGRPQYGTRSNTPSAQTDEDDRQGGRGPLTQSSSTPDCQTGKMNTAKHGKCFTQSLRPQHNTESLLERTFQNSTHERGRKLFCLSARLSTEVKPLGHRMRPVHRKCTIKIGGSGVFLDSGVQQKKNPRNRVKQLGTQNPHQFRETKDPKPSHKKSPQRGGVEGRGICAQAAKRLSGPNIWGIPISSSGRKKEGKKYQQT